MTDGSLTPEDAIAYSAKIIKDQISVFINFDERVSGDMRHGSSDSGETNEHLFKSIDDLVNVQGSFEVTNSKTYDEIVTFQVTMP